MSSTPIQVIPLTQIPIDARAATEPDRPIVLVVDDEFLIADTVSAILSQNGCTAVPSYRGADALDLARLLRPHLVLTDVAMPEMNGLELAQALHQLCPECRVLLLSGHISATELVERMGTAAGNPQLLLKPIRPLELIRHVHESLQMRFAAN